MLDGYHTESRDEKNRMLAVQAALEIAKASVGSTGAGTQSKVSADLKAVANAIDDLADAIQNAISKE